jgi:MCP family monocarboxylic acid transporter-like MFS transporter 10
MQTMRRRLPPVVVSGGLFNLQQFKSPAYSIYCSSGFVAFLGLYTGQFPAQHSSLFRILTHAHGTVLTFIDASGPSQDIPLHLSSYLVAIANAGSAIGRLSSGILADRVGASSLPPLVSFHLTNSSPPHRQQARSTS